MLEMEKSFPLLKKILHVVVWQSLVLQFYVSTEYEPVCHLEELEAPQAPPLRAARTPTP